MMRILLLTLVIGLSSATAMASNPMIRACTIAEGTFWVLEGGQEYPMCFFDNAGLGALEFFKFKSNQGVSLAIQAYKAGSSSCQSAGAVQVQGSDSNGQTFQLCQFSDGSLVVASTLATGPGSAATAKLDQALSSTY